VKKVFRDDVSGRQKNFDALKHLIYISAGPKKFGLDLLRWIAYFWFDVVDDKKMPLYC